VILLASVGLVLATATAVAPALGLDWPMAWVLGAVLAPTDATAVATLAGALPRRVRTMLGPSMTSCSPPAGAAGRGAAAAHRHPDADRGVTPAQGGQAVRAMYFSSRNSRIPSELPSRPRPLCLTPPNGAAGSLTTPRLTATIPASIRRATAMASRSSPNT